MRMSGQYEAILKEILTGIREPDASAKEVCRRRWDSLAKPVDGLGQFEELIVRLAGIQHTPDVRLTPRAAVVMCADHGVTCEQVTQTDSSVTVSVARAIAGGTSTINVLAEAVSADVFAVDLGMNLHDPIPGILDYPIGCGTANIAEGPAMSRKEACAAVLKGIETAERLSARGYRLLAAGEMGIGNTTAASAIIAALTGRESSEVTGRGAGLPDDRYRHKIEIVQRAVSVNRPDPEDPLDVLSKLGGYEIAGMTGLFLGGAITGTAVVIDGLISAVSALLARKLCPLSTEYMMASHAGREPASRLIMDLLAMKPVLDAGMSLGEATGAVLLFPLLDAALALYRNGEIFAQIDVEPYERYAQP